MKKTRSKKEMMFEKPMTFAHFLLFSVSDSWNSSHFRKAILPIYTGLEPSVSITRHRLGYYLIHLKEYNVARKMGGLWFPTCGLSPVATSRHPPVNREIVIHLF